MASSAKRLATNIAGEFYVDATCIDCGTCRWMAPDNFDRMGQHSRVHQQPRSENERLAMLQAMVSCPTGSIGCLNKPRMSEITASFPRLLVDNVAHCGFHSPDSFGATSYLIVRPQGNVLVDSPRYNRQLVRRIEELGGVALMFLTHQDDVADHERFRAHFGCKRILHKDDVTEKTREVEVQLTGMAPVQLDEDLLVIPTPGHTRGSACLLYRNTFLFSGDHVTWSLRRHGISAFIEACWYDWHEQVRSMRRLAEYSFEHLLPGHGSPCHFPRGDMAARLRQCIEWMESVG